MTKQAESSEALRNRWRALVELFRKATLIEDARAWRASRSVPASRRQREKLFPMF